MIVSNYGLNLIKVHETLKLKPYVDVNRFAIGYGNNFYEDGTPVTLQDPPITEQRADQLFKNFISIFSDGVESNVTSTINQNQFDALVSLAYNIGIGAFKSSTLLSKVNNDPTDSSIRYEFSRWNKSNGVPLPGLTNRRKQEADLYFRGIDEVDNSEQISNAGNEAINDDTNDVLTDDDGGGGGSSDGSNNNTSNNNEYKRNIGIENVLKPTIKIAEIVYNNDAQNEESTITVGKITFVVFNDMQLNYIDKFVLSSSGFLPTISIVFIDSYGFFDNLRFANDDDRVRVFLDSKNTLIRPIFLEFKIIKFNNLGGGKFGIEGSLNINKMYTTNIESFSQQTSYEVLKSVAESTGLGFSTNISNTDDQMTWVNPGERGMDFCKSVVQRSYRSDQSFMWGFVDFYYNLNFVDIEAQLSRNISEQLGIISTDLNHIQKSLKQEETDSVSFVYLTNDGHAQGTTNYFESHRIFNRSTLKSIQTGYSNKVSFYDWGQKDLLIFRTDSLTTNTPDRNVILKSEDTEFLTENVRYHWEGKLLRNNVHKNYHYSSRQNINNLNEIQKIGMEVILATPNYNIFKFMKIYVLMINQGLVEISPLINTKLTGEWLVTDIEFFMTSNQLKQKVTLVRRDLGFSSEEVEESQAQST